MLRVRGCLALILRVKGLRLDLVRGRLGSVSQEGLPGSGQTLQCIYGYADTYFMRSCKCVSCC